MTGPAAIDVSGIREIEHVFVPMSDGVRLAARLFLPADAALHPVPAILEYLPYRKRDLMRARDEPIHRYFAHRGYASVRVDIRGTGDSEGVFHDEYSVQEGRDALEVLAWIAAQPWCAGKVGMIGISWGGFNALQIAALRPPELGAVISLCAADDRYADDAHYMGGCLLNENMQWGTILTMYAAYPPDPETFGAGWRDAWRQRIESLRPYPAVWMEHPARDDFWKHGSVCEDYAAIEVPVYAIGGWADGYSNAVFRLMSQLPGPRKGLVGPWAHLFPHEGVPGPAIGFLQEAVRFWDHWLRGVDTGIMREPLLRVFMQDAVSPRPQYETRPGRWVAEESWPSARITMRALYLDVGQLTLHAPGEQVLSFSSPQSTGARSGEWCAFGADGEMPRDQRPDDGGSLVFDSDPLPERLEILGAPRVRLCIASDQPVALLAVRLCDVAPDGSSLRVTYGLANLTQRESRERPAALTPGERFEVELALNDIAHAFAPGHRVRLALSTSYWPIAWPPPRAVTLQVFTGSSRLELPSRPERDADASLRPFPPPEAATGTAHKKIVHLPMQRHLQLDLATNEFVYTLRSDGGELDGAARAWIADIDLEIGSQLMKRYRIIEDDPLSAQTEMSIRTEFQRGAWDVRLVCRSRLSATAESFQFSYDLETFENGRPFAERSFAIAIPRRLL